jgi:hypothetical protein
LLHDDRQGMHNYPFDGLPRDSATYITSNAAPDTANHGTTNHATTHSSGTG